LRLSGISIVLILSAAICCDLGIKRSHRLRRNLSQQNSMKSILQRNQILFQALNPQENVWEYIRHNYLAGRVYNAYDEIVTACSDAWNKFIAQPGLITSIASRNWLSWKD
jgi:hypothetical protein